MPQGRGHMRDERRRDTRVELKIPVDYSSVDDFFTEFTSNINEGGMFVEMEKPPELDTVVQLQFRLPGTTKPVKVLGRVAWSREEGPDGPTGVGIEFHDLSAEIRDTINQVVRQLRRPG
jgi:uncharacterized protein (TIGR02266 family)